MAEIKSPPRPWIRLFAFLFDLYFHALPARFLFYFINKESYIKFFLSYYGLSTVFFNFLVSLPFMALCMSVFRTTLGKWLLSSFVVKIDGAHLRFMDAYKRCTVSYLAVIVVQIYATNNFLMSFISFVFMVFTFTSYRFLIINKHALWDTVFHTKVIHKPIVPLKAIVFTVIFAATLLLTLYTFLDYFIELLDAYEQYLSTVG